MESWSANSIPEDLWREILSRLPVKSLLRFLCVSKSWRSLIADPIFHHSLSHSSDRTNLLYACQASVQAAERPDYVIECSTTTVEIADVYATMDEALTNFHTSRCPIYLVIEGFINGLFLLQECLSEELMLWNPLIRKLKRVPPSPEISNELKNINLGIGFDPSTKDYKVVRLFSQFKDNIVHSVAVYSVMTDSWRVVEFPVACCSDWNWSFSSHFGRYGIKTVSFPGYICFIANSVDSDNNPLVLFDLRREVFASISLPKHCYSRYRHEIVVVNGECWWVENDFWSGKGSIWVLEGCGGDFESMNWEQRCSFRARVPGRILFVFRDGDLLLRHDNVVMRYDVETMEIKIVVDDDGDCINICDVYEYSESLILLR